MSKERILTCNKKVGSFPQSEKGSVLAYALIILAMMMAITASLSVNTIIAKKSASGTEFSIQSFQTADSGAQQALKKINKELEEQFPRNINDIFTCNASDVVADITDGGASGSGALYDVSFFDRYGAPLACNNAVSEIGSIKSIGKYKNTVRAVDVNINFACGTPVAYNGDTYKTISIGSQCWFAENLRTSKKSDGAPLILGTDYFCYVGGSPDPNCTVLNGGTKDANGIKYGALYTWAAAINFGTSRSAFPGPQGICPMGWHIPTDDEIKTLEMSLGMTQAQADLQSAWRGTIEGMKMKSGGTSGFNYPLAGFYATLYGSRDSLSYFWSATENDTDHSWARELSAARATIMRLYTTKASGLSVRCVSD